ncbi:MAG: hypothetical protein IT167_25635 [Bryobacterales bacterium]|nr:hypothetical protein [Bryobacterales bacterium]
MNDRCEDEIQLRRTRRQGAGRPKKALTSAPARIPRIARLMALAIKFQEMVDRGEVRDYADLARLGYVTRARITQIMNLLNLAPDIQDELLSCASDTPSHWLTERHIRSISSALYWSDQRARFKAKRKSAGQAAPSRR